ncbi:serine/threonine-protein kinase pkn1 [bacterium MnTg02]|nr:serine/threonine-protein kinase pkn1 [bacterium MnTg02]
MKACVIAASCCFFVFGCATNGLAPSANDKAPNLLGAAVGGTIVGPQLPNRLNPASRPAMAARIYNRLQDPAEAEKAAPKERVVTRQKSVLDAASLGAKSKSDKPADEGSGITAPNIKCVDDQQLVEGYEPIQTPYCEDLNLIKVARSYGIKFSFAEVVHNPNIKYIICYAIGHDTRVHSACGNLSTADRTLNRADGGLSAAASGTIVGSITKDLKSGAADDSKTVSELKETKVAVGVFPEKPKAALARLPFEPEMVRIPGGLFEMGCVSGKGCEKDEKPVHHVTIKAFEIGKYEVTFDEWDACVAGGGCKNYKPNDQGWGRGKRPVIDVSWEDAQAYVTWLSGETGKTYRLPSEAEWEYAARAKTSSVYWWGDRASHEHANYGKEECCEGLAKGVDKWDYTSPVGSFPKNPFGLHDVQGNVWEWVEDCWHKNYRRAPKDGSAWLSANISDCAQRVLRGGSWYYDPQNLRSADRVRSNSDLRSYVLGFRISRTL